VRPTIKFNAGEDGGGGEVGGGARRQEGMDVVVGETDWHCCDREDEDKEVGVESGMEAGSDGWVWVLKIWEGEQQGGEKGEGRIPEKGVDAEPEFEDAAVEMLSHGAGAGSMLEEGVTDSAYGNIFFIEFNMPCIV
jgi:hypothetical protein